MYLLNKLRSHPPPKVKVPTNKTNDTAGNETKVCLILTLKGKVCVHRVG